jgi:hypothetical protein
VQIQAGLHTGEVELRNGDIGGIAVHLAARVMAAAGSGEIFTSRTVRDLVVGSDIEVEDRGLHRLKGIEGSWQLFAVTKTWPLSLRHRGRSMVSADPDQGCLVLTPNPTAVALLRARPRERLGPAGFVLWSHQRSGEHCQPASVNRLTRGTQRRPQPAIRSHVTITGIISAMPHGEKGGWMSSMLRSHPELDGSAAHGQSSTAGVHLGSGTDGDG